MNDSNYQRISEDFLNMVQESLEEADAKGLLELEEGPDSVSIIAPSGKQLLLSKHRINKQLWLSSPMTGGHHFSYDDATSAWLLKDGRSLSVMLSEEIFALCGVKVTL